LSWALGCAAHPVATSRPSPPPNPSRATTAAPATPAAVDPPAACPSVALIARPPWKRPWADMSQARCYKPALTPGVDAVPFGRDIDDALYCIAAYYEAPGALPLDDMLAGAATDLARVYPQLHAELHDRRVTLSDGARTLTAGPAYNLDALATELVGLAELARAVVSKSAIASGGNPEHVLLQGALDALPWRGVLHTRWNDPPPRPNPAFAAERYDGPSSFFGPVVDGIAYVKVGYFDRGMTERFRVALARVDGLRGVVLDLRGTPGGHLTEAVALTDLFLRRGCLAILRTGERAECTVAHDQRGDVDAPLVVLVDRRTAYGAELVAATLQASGRAVVVGESSAGRGAVLGRYDLGSGAQLTIPIGELLAGNGKPFQGQGVTPDRAVPADLVAEPGFDRAATFALHLLRSR
jgi:hypothetical protein